jgi:hypothetical protein
MEEHVGSPRMIMVHNGAAAYEYGHVETPFLRFVAPKDILSPSKNLIVLGSRSRSDSGGERKA